MDLGYLRENQILADKAGKDKDTGLCRTGLDTYLKIIFPDVTDWVCNKCVPILLEKEKSRIRPDYRSEQLKLIIEFDGLPHYQNPDVIINDELNTKLYEKYNYKVVRIPYFIQLTNEVVLQMFNVKVQQKLFPEEYASLGWSGRCTPAYLCPLGIKRMAKEFKKYPKQLDVNIKYLASLNNDELTGLSYLQQYL